MRIRVEVKKSHIKNGKKSNVKSCPVALALKGMGYRSVFANLCRIAIRDKGGFHAFKTPLRVERFMELFDSGFITKPFTFIMDESK